jgi:putative nucleotidyltransferase with HDIG domain
LKKKDGMPFFASISAVAIKDERGIVQYYDGIIDDITERINAEKDLKNSYLKLKTVLNGTVNALASTTEKRDPYTAGHQHRVTQLAKAIAHEMGLESDRIDCIKIAGIVHDIGKIHVAAEILNKPIALNDLEMALVKTHCKAGYEILETIAFPCDVAMVVLQHHERINGSGYPQGLTGEEILLEAKILAVADVVEAMVSHRPYRAALSTDKALEEISSNRGVLFDEDVVDICLRLFARGFEFE